jgi:hypothetical protein
VLQATLDATPVRVEVSEDLSAYVQLGLLPDLQSRYKTLDALTKATTIDDLLGDTDPAIPVRSIREWREWPRISRVNPLPAHLELVPGTSPHSLILRANWPSPRHAGARTTPSLQAVIVQGESRPAKPSSRFPPSRAAEAQTV